MEDQEGATESVEQNEKLPNKVLSDGMEQQQLCWSEHLAFAFQLKQHFGFNSP